ADASHDPAAAGFDSAVQAYLKADNPQDTQDYDAAVAAFNKLTTNKNGPLYNLHPLFTGSQDELWALQAEQNRTAPNGWEHQTGKLGLQIAQLEQQDPNELAQMELQPVKTGWSAFYNGQLTDANGQ